jgi:hypothetical protein
MKFSELSRPMMVKICQYYGLDVNDKMKKSKVFEMFSNFEEEKLFVENGNLCLVEELSDKKFGGNIYYYENKVFSNFPFLKVLILESFEEKYFEHVGMKPCPMHVFDFQNKLYGIDKNSKIYSIDVPEFKIFPEESLEIPSETESYDFFQCKDSKIYFVKYYSSDHNVSLLEFDLISKSVTEKIEILSPTYCKLKCILEKGFLFSVNGNFNVFHRNGGFTPIESLSHICFGNFFYQKETDLLYVSNGSLIENGSLSSNEIFIFSSKDLEKPLKKFWTSKRIFCESIFVHRDYIYFCHSRIESLNIYKIFYRSKLMLKSFSLTLKNPSFSDFTFIVNDQKYFSHKFILSKFTKLDLFEDELTIKMNEPTFKKAMEFIYDGIVPSLDSSEISELKDKLQMKIKNNDQYCIGYKDIILNSNHFDFLIKFDKIEFKCHKLILSRESEYFKTLFHGNFNDSNINEIVFNELSPNQIGYILFYFYSHSLIIESVELMIALIEPSKFLICNHFTDFLKSKLMISVKKKNVIMIFKYAFKEKDELLQKECMELIKKHYTVEDLMKLIANCSCDISKEPVPFEEDMIEPQRKKQKK